MSLPGKGKVSSRAAPLLSRDDGGLTSIGGWALLFHPDLLHGTHLEEEIRKCTFFNYSVNEALHMSREEYELMESILRQIRNELKNPRDREQDAILTEYIALLLKYCERYYNRQFITRKVVYSDLLTRFQDLLQKWYDDGRQNTEGIPSVDSGLFTVSCHIINPAV